MEGGQGLKSNCGVGTGARRAVQVETRAEGGFQRSTVAFPESKEEVLRGPAENQAPMPQLLWSILLASEIGMLLREMVEEGLWGV